MKIRTCYAIYVPINALYGYTFLLIERKERERTRQWLKPYPTYPTSVHIGHWGPLNGHIHQTNHQPWSWWIIFNDELNVIYLYGAGCMISGDAWRRAREDCVFLVFWLATRKPFEEFFSGSFSTYYATRSNHVYFYDFVVVFILCNGKYAVNVVCFHLSSGDAYIVFSPLNWGMNNI